MFGLGSAFVFLVELDSVMPGYRATMTTSAIICGVAAVSYYFIANQYTPNRSFPTVIRYFDWTITTPLLLLKYPEMLKVSGTVFAWKLILADLFMIVTGFIGELYGTTIRGHWYPDTSGAIGAHYVWGAVSTLGYLVVVFLLLTEGARLATAQPETIRHGIKTMNMYLLTLWGVYSIIYLLEGLSASHLAWGVNLDWFNTAGSVADVINKVGFGITAFLAVGALAGNHLQGQYRLQEDADGISSLRLNKKTGQPEGQVR